MLDTHPLGLLERAGLRKAAQDAGFDVLRDEPDRLCGSSSHAPLSCLVGKAADAAGYSLGLSMPGVARALGCVMAANATVAGGIAAAPYNGPGGVKPTPMVGWCQAADFAALGHLLSRAWGLSRALPNQLERRFEVAVAQASATEREASVRQRIGQGLFRDGLMLLWGGRCAITGLAVPELLRASHAKPWAQSTDAERLDVYNGLLLAAHWDAAFDAGLITVGPDGSVIASPTLPAAAALLLGLHEKMRLDLSEPHQPYLHWHRLQVFRR